MLKKLLISSASILFSSVGLVFATPARAEFVVCNRAAGRAYVAVSWTDRKHGLEDGYSLIQEIVVQLSEEELAMQILEFMQKLPLE